MYTVYIMIYCSMLGGLSHASTHGFSADLSPKKPIDSDRMATSSTLLGSDNLRKCTVLFEVFERRIRCFKRCQ